MSLNEIYDIIGRIKQDRVVGGVACAVVVLALFVAAFFRLDFSLWEIAIHVSLFQCGGSFRYIVQLLVWLYSELVFNYIRR